MQQILRVFLLFLALFSPNQSALRIDVDVSKIASRASTSYYPTEFLESLIKTKFYDLLGALITNPKYPFKDTFIELCKSTSSTTLLKIRHDLFKKSPSILRQILIPECLTASPEPDSLLYSYNLIPTSIQPLEYPDFRPSNLKGTFDIHLAKAIREKDRKRLSLSNFCSDPYLNPGHLNSIYIGKIMGPRCLKNIIRSGNVFKHGLLRHIFNAFTPSYSADYDAKDLMKLISLLAFRKGLISYEKERKMCMEYLQDHFFVLEAINEPSSLPLLSKKMLSILNVKTFIGVPNSVNAASIIHQIYRAVVHINDINVVWILNFASLWINASTPIINVASLHLLIDWFFFSNPSAEEICRFYRLFDYNTWIKFRSKIYKKLARNEELFEIIYEQCPSFCYNEDLPLKTRVNRFLRKERNIDAGYELIYTITNPFHNLTSCTRFILYSGNEVMELYRGMVLKYTDDFEFGDIPTLFTAWINHFLKAKKLYHVLGHKDNKPIILPSLKMPCRLANVFARIIVRMIVFRLDLPFYFSKEFYSASRTLRNTYIRLTDRYDDNVKAACDIEPDAPDSRIVTELNFKYRKLALLQPLTRVFLSVCAENIVREFYSGLLVGFGDGDEFTEDEMYQIIQNKMA